MYKDEIIEESNEEVISKSSISEQIEEQNSNLEKNKSTLNSKISPIISNMRETSYFALTKKSGKSLLSIKFFYSFLFQQCNLILIASILLGHESSHEDDLMENDRSSSDED